MGHHRLIDSTNNGRHHSTTLSDIYYSPEFDVKYKLLDGLDRRGDKVFEKVTDSWLKKSRATSIKVLRGGELVTAKDDDENDLMKATMFHNTLRFDTVGSDPHNFTSLGAKGALPPKKTITAGKKKERSNDWTNKSTFTKIDVKPNASFLAPTESYRHKADVTTHKHKAQIEEEYLFSMRNHRILPTQKFLNRRNSMRGSTSNPTNTGVTGSPSSPGNRSSPTQNAQPFPEHLRGRLRSTPKSTSEMHRIELQQTKNKLIGAAYNSFRSDMGMMFDKMNKDRSGDVTLDELAYNIQLLVPTLGERSLRSFVAAIDSDGDGFVDRNTFIEFVGKKDPSLDGLTSRITSPSRLTSRTDMNTESELDGYEHPDSPFRRGRSLSPELDPRAHFLNATESTRRHLTSKGSVGEKSNRYLEQ